MIVYFSWIVMDMGSTYRTGIVGTYPTVMPPIVGADDT